MAYQLRDELRKETLELASECFSFSPRNVSTFLACGLGSCTIILHLGGLPNTFFYIRGEPGKGTTDYGA